jgi:hypothetical protein
MPRVLTIALLALLLVLTACRSSKPVTKDVAEKSSVSTSLPKNGSGSDWVTSADADAFEEPGVDGVLFEEALESMPSMVCLPSPDVAGEIKKVLQWEKGSMGLRYASGLTLLVEPRRDLDEAYQKNLEMRSSGSVQYSDGRRHLAKHRSPDPVTASSGKVEAYSVGGGDQLLAEGEVREVRLQLRWNDANYTYTLYSQDKSHSLDELLGLMNSVEPVGGS